LRICERALSKPSDMTNAIGRKALTAGDVWMEKASRGAARGLGTATFVGVLAAVYAGLGAWSPPAGAATLPSCSTRNLEIRDAGAQAATGHLLLALSYQNVTRRTCITYGFPGITLYSHGRRIAVAKRGRSHPYSVLYVRPGRRVYGVIEWAHFPFPGHRRCPVVTGVGVYAPNSTQQVRAQFASLGIYCGDPIVYPLASSPSRSLEGNS
jgi:hypothetical protein